MASASGPGPRAGPTDVRSAPARRRAATRRRGGATGAALSWRPAPRYGWVYFFAFSVLAAVLLSLLAGSSAGGGSRQGVDRQAADGGESGDGRLFRGQGSGRDGRGGRP